MSTPENTPVADPLDLDTLADEWLQVCGPCDAGLLTTCTHPDKDPRPIIYALVDELSAARATIAELQKSASFLTYCAQLDRAEKAEAELAAARATIARVEAAAESCEESGDGRAWYAAHVIRAALAGDPR